MFLNPTLIDVRSTALLLHDIEKLLSYTIHSLYVINRIVLLHIKMALDEGG